MSESFELKVYFYLLMPVSIQRQFFVRLACWNLFTQQACIWILQLGRNGWFSFGWQKNYEHNAAVWLRALAGANLVSVCYVHVWYKISHQTELFWQLAQYFMPPKHVWSLDQAAGVALNTRVAKFYFIIQGKWLCFLSVQVTAYSKFSVESKFLKRLIKVLVGMFLKRWVNGREFIIRTVMDHNYKGFLQLKAGM